MDRLTVKSMQFEGAHGVHEEERRRGNRFEIDVSIVGDFSVAGQSDQLELAIDYQQIERLVARIIKGPSISLIETLCYRIGDCLQNEIPGLKTTTFEITLRKLNPPLNTPTAHTEIRMQWPRP